MFSWKDPPNKSGNDKNDSVNEETRNRSDADSIPVSVKRISKSWLAATKIRGARNSLEVKSAQHDLLKKQIPDPDENLESKSNISYDRANRLSKELEPRRVSSRPLYVVKQYDSDILKFKEDNYDRVKQDYNGKFVAISILPADEMNSLTSEIKLWHKHRKSFKLAFSLAMCFGVMVLLATLTFALLWYAPDDYFPSLIQIDHYAKEGSLYYNVHMNLQVTNLLLMTVVINMLRLLPQVKITRVLLYHSILACISFGLSMMAVYFAIEKHKIFTNINMHFFSLHSWIGLMGNLFYLYTFASGFLVMYYPHYILKESHARSAISTFMICAAAATCGFFSRTLRQIGPNYGHISVPGVLANTVGVLIVIFCIFVRIAAASFKHRRRPRPQWDVIVYRSMEAIEDIYLEIHDMYDSFEMWVKQVNQARLKALLVPRSIIRSSLEAGDKNSSPPQVKRRSLFF